VKDPVTYTQLKKIFDQYACVEQMEYCNHLFDTQMNESLNQAMATVAPKILVTLVVLASRVELASSLESITT
jgi:hypothetical protein